MLRRFLLLLALSALATGAWAQPVPVEVVETGPGAWQLLRDGEPYFIRGAGGDGPLDLLAASGANTVRTWGIGPETGALLDAAHARGLTVALGHWLGHERHGFDYHDPDALAEQLERVRRDVLAHRDHPALLLWGVGNEMEGFAEGDDPAVWSHVQEVAALIHELDPHHPTMTVTAEIGGRRVESIRTHCPDIDIHGINSYGGGPSVPDRYREQGGTKPIVFTEFGPPGVWEIELTSYGSPPELTSTAKAAHYRRTFEEGCRAAGGLCLGGFAFTWGFKMEATSTWYGMLLPTGEKLEAVDAMTELWTGRPPADRCPEIRSFGLIGPDVVPAGQALRATLDAVDPEGAALDVRWLVRREANPHVVGGDVQPLPLELDGVITESSNAGATVALEGGGVYRLYATVRDGTGGAAVASVPFQVEGPPGGVRARMPVAVYADDAALRWAPSGWMGATDALELDLDCTVAPRSGDTCLEVFYDEPGMWAGVAWQDPPNDWGDAPGGYDLTGARRLVFWARGAEGGERVSFGVGLLGSDKPYPDSVREEKKGVKLKKEWKRYTIDLGDADLRRVKTPFVWTVTGQGRPLTFYLDDIRFE